MASDPLRPRRAAPWAVATSLAVGVGLGALLGVLADQPAYALLGLAAGGIVAALIPPTVRNWPVAPPFERLLDPRRRGPEALLERYAIDVIEAGDFDAADRLFSAEHVYQDPDGERFLGGPAGMRELAATLRAAIPAPCVEVLQTRRVNGGGAIWFEVAGHPFDDPDRRTAVRLRWRSELRGGRLASTRGDVALLSRLSWILPAAHRSRWARDSGLDPAE